MIERTGRFVAHRVVSAEPMGVETFRPWTGGKVLALRRRPMGTEANASEGDGIAVLGFGGVLLGDVVHLLLDDFLEQTHTYFLNVFVLLVVEIWEVENEGRKKRF